MPRFVALILLLSLLISFGCSSNEVKKTAKQQEQTNVTTTAKANSSKKQPANNQYNEELEDLNEQPQNPSTNQIVETTSLGKQPDNTLENPTYQDQDQTTTTSTPTTQENQPSQETMADHFSASKPIILIYSVNDRVKPDEEELILQAIKNKWLKGKNYQEFPENSDHTEQEAQNFYKSIQNYYQHRILRVEVQRYYGRWEVIARTAKIEKYQGRYFEDPIDSWRKKEVENADRLAKEIRYADELSFTKGS